MKVVNNIKVVCKIKKQNCHLNKLEFCLFSLSLLVLVYWVLVAANSQFVALSCARFQHKQNCQDLGRFHQEVAFQSLAILCELAPDPLAAAL